MIKEVIPSTLSLKDLAQELQIDLPLAQQLGRKALLAQLLERQGHPTTRCEDVSGAPGYTGDLEQDYLSTRE